MQLLNTLFFADFITVLVACVVVAGLATLGTYIIGVETPKHTYAFVAALSFSTLGFVTGEIMAESREPAVAAVLPAALTLVGGLSAYLIGTKGLVDQFAVSVLVLCFSVSLYIGAFYGAQTRSSSDLTLSEAIEIEKDKRVVELVRLKNYLELVKLKNQLQKEEAVDLSGFATQYELGDAGVEKSKKKDK